MQCHRANDLLANVILARMDNDLLSTYSNCSTSLINTFKTRCTTNLNWAILKLWMKYDRICMIDTRYITIISIHDYWVRVIIHRSLLQTYMSMQYMSKLIKRVSVFEMQCSFQTFLKFSFVTLGLHGNLTNSQLESKMYYKRGQL